MNTLEEAKDALCARILSASADEVRALQDAMWAGAVRMESDKRYDAALFFGGIAANVGAVRRAGP